MPSLQQFFNAKWSQSNEAFFLIFNPALFVSRENSNNTGNKQNNDYFSICTGNIALLGHCTDLASLVGTYFPV